MQEEEKAAEYEPAEHETHTDIELPPAMAEYVPAWQLVQAEAVVIEKLPCWHNVHAEAKGGQYEPAAHKVQADALPGE